MDQVVQETQQAQDEIIEQDKVPACGGREKPDGESDPAGEVGWFLQREREKRGLSLEDVGEHIAVHPYHIEAIEYGDMTCMPQRVEALQMISAYADFLGFHPDPLLEHYIKILPAPQLAPRTHPASPAPLTSARIYEFGKKLPKLPALNFKLPTIKMDNNGIVASVAAAFMLFAGTTWLVVPGQKDVKAIDVVAQMPAVDDQPMPAVVTGQDSADVKVTETDDMTVATTEDAPKGEDLGAFIQDQLGVDATASTEAAAPEPEVKVAAVEPPASTGAQVFGDSSVNARLVITAKAPVWVRIEDAQGNVVMTQMFNTGDSFRVPSDRKGLVVIARDGSHLVYSIDGKDRGVMGRPGEILAGEELDVEKLLAKG
jgi:cytoskeleton protein RodZ